VARSRAWCVVPLASKEGGLGLAVAALCLECGVGRPEAFGTGFPAAANALARVRASRLVGSAVLARLGRRAPVEANDVNKM